MVIFLWVEGFFFIIFAVDWVGSFFGAVKGDDLWGNLESQFEEMEDHFKVTVCFGYFFKNIPCRDIVEGKMKLILKQFSHISILMAIQTMMKQNLFSWSTSKAWYSILIQWRQFPIIGLCHKSFMWTVFSLDVVWDNFQFGKMKDYIA